MLERDFQRVYRLNALDWVAGDRDWRQFYRFVDGLRNLRGTEYHAAWANSPEVAEELSKQPLPTKQEPSLVGYDTLTEHLTNIEDLLIALGHAQGGSSTPPRFNPRPEYLHEKIRARRNSELLHKNVFSVMLPHAYKDEESYVEEDC